MSIAPTMRSLRSGWSGSSTLLHRDNVPKGRRYPSGIIIHYTSSQIRGSFYYKMSTASHLSKVERDASYLSTRPRGIIYLILPPEAQNSEQSVLSSNYPTFTSDDRSLRWIRSSPGAILTRWLGLFKSKVIFHQVPTLRVLRKVGCKILPHRLPFWRSTHSKYVVSILGKKLKIKRSITPQIVREVRDFSLIFLSPLQPQFDVCDFVSIKNRGYLRRWEKDNERQIRKKIRFSFYQIEPPKKLKASTRCETSLRWFSG